MKKLSEKLAEMGQFELAKEAIALETHAQTCDDLQRRLQEIVSEKTHRVRELELQCAHFERAMRNVVK